VIVGATKGAIQSALNCPGDWFYSSFGPYTRLKGQ